MPTNATLTTPGIKAIPVATKEQETRLILTTTPVNSTLTTPGIKAIPVATKEQDTSIKATKDKEARLTETTTLINATLTTPGIKVILTNTKEQETNLTWTTTLTNSTLTMSVTKGGTEDHRLWSVTYCKNNYHVLCISNSSLCLKPIFLLLTCFW